MKRFVVLYLGSVDLYLVAPPDYSLSKAGLSYFTAPAPTPLASRAKGSDIISLSALRALSFTCSMTFDLEGAVAGGS